MNTDGTGFHTCKECHKTESLWYHTTTDHKEGEQLEDRISVGASSCNSGDGMDQRMQSLMFDDDDKQQDTTIFDYLFLKGILLVVIKKSYERCTYTRISKLAWRLSKLWFFFLCMTVGRYWWQKNYGIHTLVQIVKESFLGCQTSVSRTYGKQYVTTCPTSQPSLIVF